VCPVRYDLRFYIPEDDILHSHRRQNLKSYIAYNTFAACAECAVSFRYTPSDIGTQIRHHLAVRHKVTHIQKVCGLRFQYILITYRWEIQTYSTNKQTPWSLVRKRTIPTEGPPLVGEI
jgi:hypothetical protein